MTDITLSGRSPAAEAGDTVAVLGNGIMGSAMAPNLVAAGPHTTVWDRSEQATAALACAGVPVVATPPPAPAARP